jgi:hypothetical protein
MENLNPEIECKNQCSIGLIIDFGAGEILDCIDCGEIIGADER